MAEEKDYIVQLAETLLKQETEDMLPIKKQILERIAAESDIKPARVPAPLNITEIGGYFNLMMKMKKEAAKEEQKAFSDMLTQTLTSILGLPMQAPK